MVYGEKNDMWPQLMGMETKILDNQLAKQERAKEKGNPDLELLENKDTHLAGNGHDEDPPRLT